MTLTVTNGIKSPATKVIYRLHEVTVYSWPVETPKRFATLPAVWSKTRPGKASQKAMETMAISIDFWVKPMLSNPGTA